jgi:hypothetical protein
MYAYYWKNPSCYRDVSRGMYAYYSYTPQQTILAVTEVYPGVCMRIILLHAVTNHPSCYRGVYRGMYMRITLTRRNKPS